MNRIAYYHKLVFLDLVRLWKTVQHHIVIVAGICLPILLLLGLKNGHVEDLRRDLVQSPTGRRISFYSVVGGEVFDQAVLKQMMVDYKNVDLIIPERRRQVTIENVSDKKVLEDITMYGTTRGDPVLESHVRSIPGNDVSEILLSAADAEELGVSVGDEVTVHINRQNVEGENETATLVMKVHAIVEKETDDGGIAYAPISVMERFEEYITGYSVEDYGWPSIGSSPPDNYKAYLVFCEAEDPLTPQDGVRFKERQLILEEIQDSQVKSLYGLIPAEKVDDLVVFKLTHELSESLTYTPGTIMRFTQASDIVIPWNDPLPFEIDDQLTTLLGISMPQDITWLQAVYLHDKTSVFLPEESYDYLVKILTPAGRFQGEDNEPTAPVSFFDLRLNEANSLPLAGTFFQGTDSVAAKVPVDRIAVIPAPLLYYLHAMNDGEVEWDPTVDLFVRKREAVPYTRANMYVLSIDDVPGVVEQLQAAGYSVSAEDGLIREIHGQTKSLAILVYVVGLAVFVFGVLTVLSVLMDSTERKRGTIGILRVMGVSQAGIFYLVVLRALAIGLLSGILTQGIGHVCAYLLRPYANIVITRNDMLLVMIGCIMICAIGAVMPALRASRMDPFEAIIEGRFT
jgi:ABC-type lipoprotein release transport system permease subunit